MSQPISELMTKKNLITAKEVLVEKRLLDILHSNKIEKLIVIDKDKRCVGLITVTNKKIRKISFSYQGSYRKAKSGSSNWSRARWIK